MKPSLRYAAEVESGLLRKDALQLATMNAFDRVYTAVLSPPRWSFFIKSHKVKGLYIYGSVGRGKTHLMDLFYASIPEEQGKYRGHYHEFMLWLHEQLRQQSKKQTPLDYVVKKLARKKRLVCLDEFFVNDITNAMLLFGLLKAFDKYGMILVATSNIRPDDLYLGGLQRGQFIPAIDWIKDNMEIKKLDGHIDYRFSVEDLSMRWYFPLSQESHNHLSVIFKKLTEGSDVKQSVALCIDGRSILAVCSGGDVVWFSFSVLCEEARGAADYLYICEHFNHICIEGVPKMDDLSNNEARRFLTLIDIMYEHKTLLSVSAETSFGEIYKGKKLAFEFERTVSRLNQLLTCF